MEKRYKLELVGITYNQIQSGVYALILQQVGAYPTDSNYNWIS